MPILKIKIFKILSYIEIDNDFLMLSNIQTLFKL